MLCFHVDEDQVGCIRWVECTRETGKVPCAQVTFGGYAVWT